MVTSKARLVSKDSFLPAVLEHAHVRTHTLLQTRVLSLVSQKVSHPYKLNMLPSDRLWTCLVFALRLGDNTAAQNHEVNKWLHHTKRWLWLMFITWIYISLHSSVHFGGKLPLNVIRFEHRIFGYCDLTDLFFSNTMNQTWSWHTDDSNLDSDLYLDYSDLSTCAVKFTQKLHTPVMQANLPTVPSATHCQCTTWCRILTHSTSGKITKCSFLFQGCHSLIRWILIRLI